MTAPSSRSGPVTSWTSTPVTTHGPRATSRACYSTPASRGMPSPSEDLADRHAGSAWSPSVWWGVGGHVSAPVGGAVTQRLAPDDDSGTRGAPPPAESGHQRGDAGAVLVVRRPERPAEVTLLERDPDADVAGGGDGEQQVGRAHPRGGPEGEHEPRHQRVPHEGVEPVDLQLGGRSPVRGRRPAGLAEPDELEVVDGEGRRDREHPAGRAERPEDGCGSPVDAPDLLVPRLPERQQQRETEIRGEDVGGALQLDRDESTESGLHPATRHPRVLDGEEQQERQVDDDRPEGRHARWAVDRARERHPAEEGHGPHDDYEEPAPGDAGQDEVCAASGH